MTSRDALSRPQPSTHPPEARKAGRSAAQTKPPTVVTILRAMQSRRSRRRIPYTFVNAGEMPNVEETPGDSLPGSDPLFSADCELIEEQPLTLRTMLEPIPLPSNDASNKQSDAAGPSRKQNGFKDIASETNASSFTSDASTHNLRDPVAASIITEEAAHYLFSFFIEYMNGWSLILDPALHSHDFVRRRSSFLYSAILYLAFKLVCSPDDVSDLNQASGDDVFPQSSVLSASAQAQASHRELFRAGGQLCRDDLIALQRRQQCLRRNATDYATRAFVKGDRTVEAVQAYFFLATWKEPDDGISHIQSGFAFRLGMDIELGAETPASLLHTRERMSPDDQGRVQAETLLRHFKNRQRTFFMLFVQDRSQSFHFIKSSTFSANAELLRHCQVWHTEPGSTWGDALVCASVDCRRIQGKYEEVLESIRRDAERSGWTDGPSALLSAFESDLNDWWTRWHRACSDLNAKHQSHQRDLTSRDQTSPSSGSSTQCASAACSSPAPLSRMATMLRIWMNSVKLHVASSVLKIHLRSFQIREHKEAAASNRFAGSRHHLPVFWTCVNSARGILEAFGSLPALRLRCAPESVSLLAGHAAEFLCSMACLPTLIPLGNDYIDQTKQEIQATAAAFRRCTIDPARDTAGLIAAYLESFVRLLAEASEHEPVAAEMGSKERRDSVHSLTTEDEVAAAASLNQLRASLTPMPAQGAPSPSVKVQDSGASRETGSAWANIHGPFEPSDFFKDAGMDKLWGDSAYNDDELSLLLDYLDGGQTWSGSASGW